MYEIIMRIHGAKRIFLYSPSQKCLLFTSFVRLHGVNCCDIKDRMSDLREREKELMLSRALYCENYSINIVKGRPTGTFILDRYSIKVKSYSLCRFVTIRMTADKFVFLISQYWERKKYGAVGIAKRLKQNKNNYINGKNSLKTHSH